MSRKFLILIFLTGFLLSVNSLYAQKMNILKIKENKIAADKGTKQGVHVGANYLIIQDNELIGSARVFTIRDNICALEIVDLRKKIKNSAYLIQDTSKESEVDLLLNEGRNSNINTNYNMAKTQSLYTYWGLGLTSATYTEVIQYILDEIERYYNPTHATINLDLLGFYFHVTPKSLLGFILNGVGDRYQYANGNYFQINQYTYGASSISYLGRSFGSGIFIRSDIGIANYVYDSNFDWDYTSEIGFGCLLGTGCSFDLGGTRLLFNLNYAYRNIEDLEGGALTFSIGGLF